MDDRERKFKGFYRETLLFLKDLRANNNKAWFEENRQLYERYLLEPLSDLVKDLGKEMLKIDPFLRVDSRVVSRIYRDTRFSNNKAPYRSTMWITFKRPRKDWMDAPAYFFEITPSSYRYGMGFYNASPDLMRKFRQAIDDAPQEFLKVIGFYSKQKVFAVEGEKYKKVINEAIPAEIQDWYQRKNFYLVCNRKIDERLFSSELVDDLLSGFNMVAPFYRYLYKLKGERGPEAIMTR